MHIFGFVKSFTNHPPVFLSVSCLVVLVSACGSDGNPVIPGPDLQCVQIRGDGTTQGDRNQLAGAGVFQFDQQERPAEVGLYLFEIAPAANDGLNVDTRYQFHWGNGDSFLSENQVYFEPTFEENTYRFHEQLTIVTGSGIFTDLIGQEPLTLTAEMTFGPPAIPGGVMTAAETFELGGTVCK